MKESSGDIGLMGRILAVRAALVRGGLRLGAGRLSRAVPGRRGRHPGRGLLRAAGPRPRSTAPSRPATMRARAASRRR